MAPLTPPSEVQHDEKQSHITASEIAADESTNTWSHKAARLIFQIFCLLWVVPVLVMLVLNYKTWIIGASAWCPGSTCWAEQFQKNRIFSRAIELDKNSHDLLAGLQFAAKALEIWFIIIASSLVYLYTMFLAGQKHGLPVGYLSWPTQFTDITSLLDKSLWTTAFSRRNRGSGLAMRLQTFVILGVFLCLLCNVMGPSIAVIIIPSLQWLPTPTMGPLVFNKIAATSPPRARFEENELFVHQTRYNEYATIDNIPLKCSEAQLLAHNYSCAAPTLGLTLDTLVREYENSFYFSSKSLNYGLVSNLDVSCALYNTSAAGVFEAGALWTPNLQMLFFLALDYFAIRSKAKDNQLATKFENTGPHYFDSFNVYNRSLQMKIERNGPMIGARPITWSNPGGAWTTVIDSERAMRCYEDYVQSGSFKDTFGKNFRKNETWTKCIRVGTGWAPENKQVNFSMSSYTEPSGGKHYPGVNWSLLFSDQATYVKNNIFPNYMPYDCFQAGKIKEGIHCDWDRFFSQDVPDYFANRTKNVNTWEVYAKDYSQAPETTIDFVAYVGFAQYQLNPSSAENPLLLAQTYNVPTSGKSIVIDPHWGLLAWSADRDGMILTNRTAPQQFVWGLEDNHLVAGTTAYITILNMLTQLPFSSDTRGLITVDEDHPALQRNGSVFVYAYAINNTTSRFSAAVVIVGIVLVLIHTVLSLLYYRPYKPIAHVIVAALEHKPAGEFDNTYSPDQAVRTPFMIEHHDKGLGGLKYRRSGFENNVQTI